MNNVVDQYDEQRNQVFLVDYDQDGYYFMARGTESCYEVIRRSRSVVSLVKYIANNFGEDPRVEFSETCEVLWSLEFTDGREWLSQVLEEKDE